MMALSTLGKMSATLNEWFPDREALSSDLGRLESRKITHWSEKIQYGGIVVGVIAIIASIVFAQYIFIAPGTVLVIQGSVAAYHLNDIRYLKTVEDYIEILNRRVNMMSEKIFLMKKTNEDLKKNVGEFKESIAKFQRDTIASEKNLQQRTKELSVVSEDLKHRKDELDKLKELLKPLYEQIDGVTHKMEKEITRFSEGHTLLAQKVADFNIGMHAFNTRAHAMAEEVDLFDKETDEFEENIRSLSDKVSDLKKLIKLQKELHQVFAEEQKKLKNEIGVLDEADDKIVLGVQKVHDVSHSLEETAKIFGKSSEDLAQLRQLLPLIHLLQEFNELMKTRPQEKASDILKQIIKKMAKKNE